MKHCRAMLVRDWLLNGGITNAQLNEQIDDSTLEEGKRYVNEMSSIGSSQIDIDVSSAVDDLKELKILTQEGVVEEQKAQDTLKQLWNDAF